MSTRGDSPPTTFLSAVLAGLAPDGGLYVPGSVPAISNQWRQAGSFSSLASIVLKSWLDGAVDRHVVDRIVREALDFPVPVVHLQGGDLDGVQIVELFHGPTLSFKDFGARSMAGFMTHALGDETRRTILVATSGDTGSAVADGFAGRDSIEVVLLYPKGQVSPTQERQLIVRRPGVTSFAVDGTFDDCQRVVKEAFTRGADSGLLFSSANSINIGRLLPQMTYYFWARLQSVGDDVFRCCVPSGNLGNLTAGVLAHLSGMESTRFIAAHNANDFFPNFLESGERNYKPSVRTVSNAMDVGVPSNFERLESLLTISEMRNLIWSTSVDDASTLETIRQVYQHTGYVADPHTAVGLESVRRYRAETGDDGPVVVMATAHPAKFPETILRATEQAPPVPERLRRYWEMDTSVRIIQPNVDVLMKELASRRS